jgi:hypothetical protein
MPRPPYAYLRVTAHLRLSGSCAARRKKLRLAMAFLSQGCQCGLLMVAERAKTEIGMSR